MPSPEQVVDEIFALVARHGDERYGEDVTQREHMLQVAHLAREEGHSDAIVLAAFLHDVGHLCRNDADEPSERMGAYGAAHHERIGADFLRARGFSETVARLVEGHVQAKRYLTHKHPAYHGRLSEASKQTLLHQGGPMTAAEAAPFEADPLFDLYLRMRAWDDAGKRADLDLYDVGPFRPLMLRHLTEQAAS